MKPWRHAAPVMEAPLVDGARAMHTDAPMPVPYLGDALLNGESSEQTDDGAGTPQYGRTLRRWIRDIAIGVALLVSVPVAVVGVSFKLMPFVGLTVEQRIEEVDRLRVLRRATNPSITPLAAGEALARITPLGNAGDGYETRFDGVAKERLKQIVLPALPLFPAVRDVLPTKNFDPTKLIAAAPKGFTAEESAWLERVATLPLWRDVDLVAQAAQVDVLAGRFEQPMGVSKPHFFAPFPKNSDVRKLAVAGVARAAWHISRNEWREADEALRTIVSLGFAMIDNGATIIEALMGRAVVEIGRDGLSQLAVLRGDAELERLARRPPEQKITRNPVALDVLTPADRGNMMAMLTDARVPHAVRMERAFLANYLQCDSMREVLFGHSAETRAILMRVNRELARFPSEAAQLARYDAAFEQAAELVEHRGAGVLLQGAANAASAITGNPRIAGCMVPIAGSW